MKDQELIPMDRIHPFEGHPYQVRDDEEMMQLTESIRDRGILSPLLLRPLENTENEYELISGHRRFRAAQTAGMKEVPAIVVSVTRDEAAVMLVDSNLHREHILPSEKAFAYKLKMEALSHQGKRNDLTSTQVAQKLSAERVGDDAGISKDTIRRYIRLTNLISDILHMVDTGRIAFTPAAELSYLKPEEQENLLFTMGSEDCTPSLSQAQQMHKLSQMGLLDMDMIFSLMTQQKGNQQEKISFRVDDLRQFFPKDVSAARIQETIMKLLVDYQRRQQRSRKDESR